MKKPLLLILLFGLIFLTLFLFYFLNRPSVLKKEASAGTGDNVFGFAWANVPPEGEKLGLGWISFNSLNCDPDNDGVTEGGSANSRYPNCPDGLPISSYGVRIESNGNLSGYAYFDMQDLGVVGWIDFNPAGPYPTCPATTCPSGSPNYSARVDLNTGKVTGWARALNQGGGWDGWILLGPIVKQGIDYGGRINLSTNEFEGWAWGGDVMGWISFNCNNPETGNVCNQSNYKVYTTFSFSVPPSVTEIDVDADGSDNYCDIAPGEGLIVFKWRYVDPNGDKETRYIFQVDDNSNFSSPEVNRTAEGLSNPSGTVNVQLVEVLTSAQPDRILFNRRYYWRVKVFNEKGEESDWVYGDSFQTPVHPWPWPQFTHSPQTPMVEEPTTFDGRSSSAFGGATIVSWQWQIEDAVPLTPLNQPVVQVQFTSLGQKEVILTIRDSDGFSCSKRGFIRVGLPLPTPPHEY